jgi:hypothetical protein
MVAPRAVRDAAPGGTAVRRTDPETGRGGDALHRLPAALVGAADLIGSELRIHQTLILELSSLYDFVLDMISVTIQKYLSSAWL